MAADNAHNAEQTKATAAPAKVKVVNTSMVAPSKKTETERPASCPLITFDVPYITFYYNQKLLLYKTSTNDEELRGAVERMKEGLAAALDYFYPLAGKIAKDEDGSLIVDCSGESLVGAEVIDASAEDVSVEELAEGEATELLQEVVPYTGIMNLEGLHRPLLAVQVTLTNTSILCFELEYLN